MQRIDTDLPGVCLLQPTVHHDERGFFMESYRRDRLAELGVEHPFVQDNHARSVRGVLRGLHYQLGRPQAKLVRVTRGRVFDVVVDVRRGSPAFGRWYGVVLDAEDPRMLYAPVGCAHGYLVLSDVAEFQYKCSDYYAPLEERGLAWDDPQVAIEWPLAGLTPILSARDRGWSTLAAARPEDLPELAR